MRSGRGGKGGSVLTFCSVPPSVSGCSRKEQEREGIKPPPEKGKNSNILQVGISSFIVMSSLSAAHMHMNVLDIDNSMLLSSLGASCFLLCFSPEAPVAQPRNVIGGHLLGASCGVLSHSLVTLLQTTSDWVGITMFAEVDHLMNTYVPVMCAGPLAVSSACMLMMLTRTVHFPAAGTALGIALSPSMPVSTSLSDIILSPEVVTLLANVCFSSSTLVALACVLHTGSYPNSIQRL